MMNYNLRKIFCQAKSEKISENQNMDGESVVDTGAESSSIVQLKNKVQCDTITAEWL